MSNGKAEESGSCKKGLRGGWGALYVAEMFRSWRERWILAGRRTKAAFGLVVLISAVLFTVLVLVLRNWQGDIAYVETAEAVAEAPLEEEPLEWDGNERLSPTGRTVLQKHFAALGGGQRIGSVISLLATGQIAFASGESMAAVFIHKGDQMRLSLKTSQGQEIWAVGDDDAWFCRWRAGNLVEREDLSAGGWEQLKLSRYSLQPLYRKIRESGQLGYLGTQPFEYKMSHCFEMEGPNRSRLRFFVDADSFLDVGMEIRGFEADGTLRILRQVYSERLDIGGLQVPGRIDGYIDGVRVQTFTIDDVDLNVGIFDTTFDRPTEPLVEEPSFKAESFGGAPDRRWQMPARLRPGGL